MTADEIKTTVKHHRHAAIGGGIVGVGLLVAYFAYGFAVTPAQPDLQTANAAEVVAYISNERGLDKLPQIEEQQFLLRWRDIVMKEPKKKEELKECFLKLDDAQRKIFSEAIFKHFKRAFLQDAKQYSHLPDDQKHGFLRKKLEDGRRQAVFMKDVAVGFKKQFSGRQDDFQQWLMEHTTAEERALGEPYVDALKRVREQMKKQQKAPASFPAETSRP